MIKYSLNRLPAQRLALVSIDELVEVEGDEPAFAWRYSLKQILQENMPGVDQHRIASDIDTVAYWRGFYASFKGREQDLLSVEPSLIAVWDPPINGHLIHDGFHRVAAAKLADLSHIGARLAHLFF